MGSLYLGKGQGSGTSQSLTSRPVQSSVNHFLELNVVFRQDGPYGFSHGAQYVWRIEVELLARYSFSL